MPVLWSHPPSFKWCLKRSLREYWVNNLKWYSDWFSGTIQNGLTPLTLRITEDSAKQLTDCLQLTVISIIGLLGEWNVSYVLPAHSEILILPMEYLLERKEQWTLELINNDLLVLLKLRKLNDKNVLCVWGIVWGMNINRLVVDCYIPHLILILLFNIGGGGRIWTFDLRVMSPTSYLTAPPRYWKWEMEGLNFGARDRFRTGDPQLGRLMLYLLSYSRFPNGLL